MADKNSFIITHKVVEEDIGEGIFGIYYIHIPYFLHKAKEIVSIAHGKRLIDQGAVYINGQKVEAYVIPVSRDAVIALKYGKIKPPITINMKE